jgi:WD40 repeat protein
MYFSFKFLVKKTIEQIKSGKEFSLTDGKFSSGLISSKSIPKGWKISIMDDIVYLGKEENYMSHSDVYVMLMLAEKNQNRIRSSRLIHGLGF